MTEIRIHRPANWSRLAAELAAISGALRPADPSNPFLIRARYSLVQDSNAGDVVVAVDDDAPASLANAITAAVNAHDASPDVPPLVFTASLPISGRIRTTSATPTDVYRLTLAPLTGYAGELRLIGVDSGNGAVLVVRASFAVKRLNAGAVGVSATPVIVMARHGDAATTSWNVTATIQGNDAVIQVTGASGRTIDWSVTGQVESFTPAGA